MKKVSTRICQERRSYTPSTGIASQYPRLKADPSFAIFRGINAPAPSDIAPAPSDIAPAPSDIAPAPSDIAPAPSYIAPAPSYKASSWSFVMRIGGFGRDLLQEAGGKEAGAGFGENR